MSLSDESNSEAMEDDLGGSVEERIHNVGDVGGVMIVIDLGGYFVEGEQADCLIGSGYLDHVVAQHVGCLILYLG